jgi:hypothetical protein
MPQELHAELAARSEAEGVSLNQFILSALTGVTSPPLAQSGVASAETGGRIPRAMRLSLIANAVVVAIAAATSILVLLFGWR